MVAYRITARSLDRQLVSELVLKEFESLEDLTNGAEPVPQGSSKGKVVLVLEEDESPFAGAPKRPQ